MALLIHLRDIIEAISEKSGRLTSWLAFILVITITVDVFMRYVFSISKAWYLELEWHLFAILFLMSMAYTLKHKGHVRVDVFYDRYPKKWMAVVDLVGHLLLLIPWCLIIIITSYHYGYNSFEINESSPDPGGLPCRYLIKFAITISFFLLLVQAIAELIKASLIISHKE